MERWTIGVKQSERIRLELRLRDEKPHYYMGFEASELPERALEMLRAFDFVVSEVEPGIKHTPTVFRVFDHHPVSREEVVGELAEGLFGFLKMVETNNPLRPVVEAFIRKDIGFKELKEAVGYD